MALGLIGRSRHGHHVSEVYCDVCASEELYPMLHSTLYAVKDTAIVLCEVHAILAKRRPPTPGFEEAFRKAYTEAVEVRNARRVAAIRDAQSRAHAELERKRLSAIAEQPGSADDTGDNKVPSVE